MNLWQRVTLTRAIKSFGNIQRFISNYKERFMKDIKANFYTATDEDGTSGSVPISYTPKEITITVTEDLERNITTLLLRQNKITTKFMVRISRKS
jgi:hypothetical protein